MPKVITKKAIKEFRKSLKYTQVQLAKYMGVSVHTIRTWEQENNTNTKVPSRLIGDPRTAHLAEDIKDA